MLKFVKMEGTGNDYIYINLLEKKINYDYSKLAIKLSDRHYSIGSDGVIFILPSNIADYKMIMFNKDGSEGAMCGNGIRCFAKYLYENRYTRKNILQIETLSGIKTIFLNIDKGKIINITVDMGEAIIDTHSIPLNNSSNIINLNILDKKFKFYCASIGNPHAVTFIDNIDNFDVEKYGKIIECHKIFPNKTNVEFVEIIDNSHIKMRVFERGSGETMSCGTGACISAYISIKYMHLKNNLDVKIKGGTLKILLAENNHLFLTGDANITFEGIIYEEELNGLY